MSLDRDGEPDDNARPHDRRRHRCGWPADPRWAPTSTTRTSATSCRTHCRALYTDDQLDGLDDTRRTAFLTREGDRWRVTEPVRTRVEFSVADLARDPVPDGIDVAVVANVWRFLDDDAQTRLADALHDSLRSGGILVLAGSDFVRRRTARRQRPYLSPAFTGVRLPAIEERFAPHAATRHTSSVHSSGDADDHPIG